MKGNRQGILWLRCCAVILMCATVARGAAPPPVPLAANQSLQLPRLKQGLPDFAADRDARIMVKLDISASGEVLSSTLGEGSFGQKRYADKVVRWFKGAKFEPARLDGVPTAWSGVQPVPITIFRPEVSVSPGFPGRVDKAVKLIKAGDYPAADALVQQLLFEHAASLLDYIELHRRLALANADAGRNAEALQSARDVLDARFWQFPLQVTLPRDLGELHMRLAASQGMLSEAVMQYALLGGMEKVAPAQAAQAAEWVAALKSAQPLVARIGLTTRGRTTHQMSRQLFRIENIRGSLTSAEFDCRMPGSRKPVDLAQGGQYATSGFFDPRECTLSVSGEPGTEFEIVELAGGDEGQSRVANPYPATP
jgi:hypothetical protein